MYNIPDTALAPEICSQCAAVVEAGEVVVQLQLNVGHYLPVPMWRYSCSCGRVWTNYDQRTVNYQSYKHARRSV